MKRILLFLILSAVLLTACGKKPEASETETTQAEAAQTAAREEIATVAAETQADSGTGPLSGSVIRSRTDTETGRDFSQLM